MGQFFACTWLAGDEVKAQPNKYDEAVWDLKLQRDKLQKYKKKVESVMERETKIARELLQKKQKEQAKLALQKKKYQQTLLEKAQVQLDNVQQLCDSLEFTKIEHEVFEALKQGTESLEKLNNEMKIEDVEKIMEDSREAMEYRDEISKLLSETLTPEDDEAALAELEELEKLMNEEISETTVPTKKIGETSPLIKQEEKTKVGVSN
eukprot:gene9753-2080_t